MAKDYGMLDAQFILDISENDDFTEALINVQEAIGQDDGGVASVHFSDFEQDEDGNIIVWNKKEEETDLDLLVRRSLIIQSYIETERVYDVLN